MASNNSIIMSNDDDDDDDGSSHQAASNNNNNNSDDDDDCDGNAATAKCCTVCAKLPLRVSNNFVGFSDADYYFYLMWDFEGMYKYLSHLNHLEDLARRGSIRSPIANQTADRAKRAVTRLQERLVESGLLEAGSDQNFAGKSHRARMMAPFSRQEIVVGPLLGSGSFSSVYEIQGFRANEEVSQELSQVKPYEQAAREFLIQHAQRPQQDPESSKKQRRKRYNNIDSSSTARYAMKHLRLSLLDDEKKFEQAGVDLVTEAQLLMAMDHPHIVSIRGWAQDGTDAFRKGGCFDYFIILDRLSETLEDRIYKWRQALRKYQSRHRYVPWKRQKFAAKMEYLFMERLQAAHDIASALEYLHDRRVIYRDLKSSNVGFDAHGDVKLFDFGLARLLPKESTTTQDDDHLHDGYTMSRVGTKSTMAPEVRRKKPYNLSADVYSFGVVLWEILSLSTPREYFRQCRGGGGGGGRGATCERENSQQLCLPLPVCPCWPTDLQMLLCQCLSFDPSARPTMSQVRTVLQQLLQDRGFVGKSGEKRRRRSTFRLDLTEIMGVGGRDSNSLLSGFEPSSTVGIDQSLTSMQYYEE